MKRVLLCRTDAVGDLVLCLPVARSIKAAYPDLQITLLAGKYTAPLLAGEEYLDRVVAIPGRSLGDMRETSALAHDFKQMNFDAAVLFYPRLSLAVALAMAQIPIRIGTGRRAYSMLFNRRINLSRRDSGKHELDLNYELVEQEFRGLEHLEPSLTVTADERMQADALLRDWGIGERDSFVVVHPLSHGSAPNWRLERYVELTGRLIAAGLRIVVTGSQLEAPDIEAGFGQLGQHIVNLAGKTDLPQMKAIIRRAQVVISGSTGPIHIAGAVGSFAVGIYPPESALSPVRWGPRGSANKLFVPAVDHYKGNSRSLMDSIEVVPVADFIIKRLFVDANPNVNIE